MPSHRSHTLIVLLLACFASLLLLPNTARLQSARPVIDRARGKEMLQSIKGALKELYYDPSFHGMDLDRRFKEAEAQINKATSTGQIHAIIAQVLVDLDDSHTTFFPPELVTEADFGFDLQIVGDICYVTNVKEKSDAEQKGVKAGDLIYAIEGYEPTRDSLWKISYSYLILQPPPTIRLTVQEPKGTLKDFVVAPLFTKKKIHHVETLIEEDESQKRISYYNLSPDNVICRLSEFDLSDGQVDDMMKRIRPAKTLILDLRGNPGGRVSALQRLLGYLFDKDVKIGDEKRRDKSSTRMAKTRGVNKTFQGQVFALIDSKSASAAEVFARIMQLEHRGIVIGDRSQGAVMTSIATSFAFQTAGTTFDNPNLSFYGANITISNLIMSDGNSLEKTGVKPDIISRPTGEDLASGRDPVLARAATLAGTPIDSQKAGAIRKELWDAVKKLDEKQKQ